MEVNIKKIVVKTKNESSPDPLELNSYHHTIYGTNLPEYHEATYRKFQTKIVAGRVCSIAVNDHNNVLLASLGTLYERRFKGKKRLYLHSYTEETHKLEVDDRPYLYNLSNYYVFQQDDLPDWHKIFNNPEELRIEEENSTQWYSENLRSLLERCLHRDLGFMYESICSETIPDHFYISIMSEISAKQIRHTIKREFNIKPHVFNLYFVSNLKIPDLISIGHQISIGNGTINRI